MFIYLFLCLFASFICTADTLYKACLPIQYVCSSLDLLTIYPKYVYILFYYLKILLFNLIGFIYYVLFKYKYGFTICPKYVYLYLQI